MQGWGLRSIILTDKENEAKSTELSSSHVSPLPEICWHSSKSCGLLTLSPVFLEKVNGFLSLWGGALGTTALHSWMFLGEKERGPHALVYVGPASSMWHQAPLNVGSGCRGLPDCGDNASELDGRQLWITDRTVLVLSRWEGMAAGAGSQPAVTHPGPLEEKPGLSALADCPLLSPRDTSFTFPLKGSRNPGIIYFNTMMHFIRFPFLCEYQAKP